LKELSDVGEKKLAKFLLVGIVGFVFFIIVISAVVSVLEESDTTVTKKQEAVEVKKEREVYPALILKAIKNLETSKETKTVRYQLFDQEVIKVIQYKPTDEDLEFYKKFVFADYEKMTFDYVQTLNDEELLKIIFRNRPVDLYYVHREMYGDPLGGLAYNVIQIAKEQYEGTLNQENYDIFKMTMDKHFENIE
jgi:hypothetical protein